MSAMEIIFGNLFNRQANQPPAAPAPAPAVSNNLQGAPNQQTQQTQQTAANGVVPQGSANPPAPPSPLESFKDLWQPPENKEEQQITTALDPAKTMEAAAKVDFTKILNKEALAKVQAGGDEAVQALAGLLNQTAQAVYGQSTIAASKLVEQAISQAEQKFASKVPTLVNSKAAEAKLLASNKALANPAVAPIVALIQSQLAAKYPNATSDELAEMAGEMMKGAANVFAPAPATSAPDKGKKADDDWSDFLQ